VSGIALHFEPENLIGKQVCVLVNLAPRAIKGIQSKGMVLMAEDANGQLKLLSPSDLVKPGSKVS
jgi:methionyl-tRNA synthetase